MTAVNYARHVTLGRYVFLARGEAPDPSWLEAEWAWWNPPASGVRLIGETPEQGCDRTKHRLALCGRCRATASGLAAARRDTR
jgi:hypothetical protein